MNEEDSVSLLDIRHCVVCSSQVTQVNDAVTCQNTLCNFRVTVDRCESELNTCAENGFMKFCYACGHEMECEDNLVVCGTCDDSIKFNVSTEEFISASDVMCCVICAEAVETKSSGKMFCSRAKCKFKIMDADSAVVTETLQKYVTDGKVKFCYKCGTSVRKEGKYIICNSESCSSAKLQTGLCDERPVHNGGEENLTKAASTPGSGSVAPIEQAAAGPEKNYKEEAVSGTPCTGKTIATQDSISKTTLRKPSNIQMAKEKTGCKKVGRVRSEVKQQTTSVLGYYFKAAVSAVRSALTSKMSRPVYQMVLIGETGSGKTSFLNLLCNFNLVCDLGLDDSLDLLHNFHDLDIENAQQRAMESKTSDAKYYKVTFDALEVGIIDTPGFGDSRGIEEDKKNVKRIIDTIERVEYINCICLVMNGRQARATYQLKYVLTEISATLPKTAFNNLIVVMTNSQDVTCANFDVSELSAFFGSEVIIKPEQVFYIDNPYSKLEKCRNEKKLASHQQLVDALKAAFQIAGETLVKILVAIKDFSEVHTNCFVELYNVKQEVEKKMLHLVVAQQNKEELEKQISKAKKELEAAASKKTLNQTFTSTLKVKKLIVVPTNEHNTICGAPHCNSNCHVPCSLSKTVDKENLKSCGCMDWSNKCTVCGHSYLDHFHAESVFTFRDEVTVQIDEERKKRFEDANTAQEECAKLTAEYDAELQRCEESMEDLKVSLIATVETFEKLGSSPSYEKVLECQVYVVEQRINAQERGDDLGVLNATKDELKKKLSIVQIATKKTESGKKASKIKWAQQILQVQPSASKEEIDKAYKTLVRKKHPDKQGGTDADFQSLQKAYEILSQEIV